MATAPVSYQSALIESLRAASPGFGSNNPGVMLLDNPANSKTVIDFKRTPIQPYLPPGPVVGPPAPPAPAPSPSLPPPVIGPGGSGGGAPVIGPGPGPGPVVGPVGPSAPTDDVTVPDYTDDLWGPDTPTPAPNESDNGAETFPVPAPGPVEPVDLPPLDAPAETFPVPAPSPYQPVDLPPLPSEPQAPPEVPDYTEDLWPPVEPDPVDPPQGEIDVGPTGDSQPARDAIDQIGDITEVGDPLDEWDWIEPDVPEVRVPDIPEGMDANIDFSDAELLNLMFDDFGKTWDFEGWLGGGGGGGLGGMLQYMQE